MAKEDWKKLVESEDKGLPKVKPQFKGILEQVLDNTARELNEATSVGDIAQYTPVLMSLIRRVMPSLVGNDLVGVQAMSAPTGRIFAQHVWYQNPGTDTRTETWANGQVRVSNTGTGAIDAGAGPNAGWSDQPGWSGPYSTQKGEALGWSPITDVTGASNQKLVPAGVQGGGAAPTDPADWASPAVTAYPEMSFSIDYLDVSVKTRALKGKLTTEVIQDLKAVHGLDAEAEIANILQTELTAEIDREIVARIRNEAKVGALNCTSKGVFDFDADADGRWSMEKIQNLLLQIEREATIIAMETRRGRGNFIITTPEVAAQLSMANLITNAYGNVGFVPEVNPIGISYFGNLCNRFQVYVDPYATQTIGIGGGVATAHEMIVGYKGTNQYDAGVFYCPYVPLQFFKAVGQEDFGLRLGVKSRYGMVSNPYYCASGTAAATAHTNSFYRAFGVIMNSTPAIYKVQTVSA